MFSTIITLLASFVGIWALVKYVMLIEIRVDANTFKTLYDHFKTCNKFVLNEELTSETRHPIMFSAFMLPKGLPWFFVSHGERLMQAGWHGKDYVSVLTCLRWDYSKIRDFLSDGLNEASFRINGIPVQVIMPYGLDKIGSLRKTAPEPIVHESLWKDLDQEVSEVLGGGKNKTGALLYGAPGNGKTSLVKYLSTKHRLPIMILTFNPEWSNIDLLLLFAHIPKKCLVLLEDFDNYFDKRTCVMGTGEKNVVKFTFDIILNGLDGVYNSYDKVVFIMTVNDIDKVDDALKNRPSRFKFTRNFDNPDHETRCKLIPTEWSEKVGGLSLNLDQVFRLREYSEIGLGVDDALKKLNIKTVKAEERKTAFGAEFLD